MKALALSGGSTKIAGIAGAALVVCKTHGYKPDFITGISAGSILSVPLAMGMYDVIEEITQNISVDDIFSDVPVNKKGNPSLKAIWRLITKKESLGRQGNLRKTIQKHVTREHFEDYKSCDSYSQIFLGAVEFKTGEIHYFDIKKSSYEQYLNAVDASSSIPVFVESVKINDLVTHNGVKIKDGYWMDGGTRDHVGSHWLMQNQEGIKEHISIYSRSEGFDIPNEKNWKPSGVLNMLKRSLDILNLEKSKNDEFLENVLAKTKDIKTKQIFMNIAQEIDYEVDPETLKNWFDEGAQQAESVMSAEWRLPENIELDFKGVKVSI